MTFMDGSVYDGDFVHGQKDGYGEFNGNGCSYKG